MEIKSEFHKTQKTLFRRVNQIRKINGTCDFEPEGTGYRLHYCESDDLDHTYIVQSGKHGDPFRLHDGMEGSFFHLNKGEILVYECESGNKVWFSYLKWLEELGETDLDHDVGYTEYGCLSDMVQAGLIISARHADRLLFVTANGEMKEKPLDKVVPKPEKIEETQGEIQPEPRDDEPEIFKLLARNPDLKTALEKARQFAEYYNKETGDCIRTHQVMYRWYTNGYTNFRGFQYTQAAQMRFGGRWLERAGFDYKTAVKIIAMKNLILIIPVRVAE